MDHIRQAIDTLVERVADQERQLVETKTAVNALLKVLNEPPRYSLEPDPSEAPIIHGNWRVDEFYGQPLSGVVKKILLARKAAGLGAASVNEIYSAMIGGGFNFGSQEEENAKATLRSSLRKNSAAFHRLPNGNYGLKEWYPNVRERKANGGAPAKDADGGDTGFDFDQKEQEDAERNGPPDAAMSKADSP